jgi:hypothetical protein
MAEIIPLKADRDNARDVMMCFLCTIFFFLNHQPFPSYIISFLLFFSYILYTPFLYVYCRYSWFRLLLVGIALFPFLYHASLNLVGGFLFPRIFFYLLWRTSFAFSGSSFEPRWDSVFQVFGVSNVWCGVLWVFIFNKNYFLSKKKLVFIIFCLDSFSYNWYYSFKSFQPTWHSIHTLCNDMAIRIVNTHQNRSQQLLIKS